MKSAAVLAAAVLLTTAACAPVVQGGPPIALPPGLQETAQVGSITLSSEWLNARTISPKPSPTRSTRN